MKGKQHFSFDEERALGEILTALEYGTKKQENDIINPLLEPYGLGGKPKPALIQALLKRPGFENFFLEILKSVQPFSLMLGEIYEFLNSNEVTARRRASKFLIQSEKAKATLTFDLQNFPKELIRLLSQADVSRSVVRLKFDGIDLSDVGGQWDGTQAEKDWSAISPRWDGNFYDDGFHRALVYASTILANYPQFKREADTIARPILQRLAAINEFAIGVLPEPITGETVTFYGTGSPFEFLVEDVSSDSYIVRSNDAADYLKHQVQRPFNTSLVTVVEVLSYEMRAFAIANTLWSKGNLRIPDQKDDDWAKKQFGVPLSQIKPDAYLDLLRGLAADYSSKLDKVAPVVDNDTSKVTLDTLVEFLNLPFWKNRWFVYELWTLTRTLNVAARLAQVQLNNVKEEEGGIIEWKLPGGMAQQPVAIIGDSPKQILCWAQRKTYHPGTGAGLEPDFRLTRSDPTFHDLIIIENKDRLSAQTKQLGEILDRYVGGTCAESIWLINYESFPDSADTLKDKWSPGRVYIASHFRPGLLPEDFERNIEQILRRDLDVPAVEPQTLDQERQETSDLPEVVLNWKETPRDLDLHAWLEDSSGTKHIYYGVKGGVDSVLHAELSDDQTHGNGQETLRLKAGEFKRLLIAVNNYSNERSLVDCGAEVTFHLGIQKVIFNVPTVGQGRWWSVLRMEGSAIEVLQQLTEKTPTL